MRAQQAARDLSIDRSIHDSFPDLLKADDTPTTTLSYACVLGPTDNIL